MPSLSRRGLVPPPEDLLIDEVAAGRHFEALMQAGCLVIEVRGAGWLADRYLVLLDHAWDGGSARPHLEAWAEERATVWPLSVAQFERLAREPHLLPLLNRIYKSRRRPSVDIPVRALWNEGAPATDQGCPTVPDRDLIGPPNRS